METLPVDRLQDKIRHVLNTVPDQFLFVATASQRLHLIRNSVADTSFTISTSWYGIGNREGSYMTPAGLHRVTEKIGAGAPSGRIFRDRIDTGIDWQPDLTEDNQILTRIIRMEGLEDGANRGPGIDSCDRYIYIHGTNREDRIGTPLSHGCILMRNNDIIELFDLIQEGTLVLID